MRPHSSFLVRFAVASLFALGLASSAQAQTTYYWDSNGTTAGFGTIFGTWGTDAFWGTSAAGTGATANTAITNLDTVNFGTATLNYGNGTVGVAAGGVTTGSIVIGAGQTQAINLGTAGNTVTIHSGVTKNAGSGTFIFVSPVALAGNQTWTNNSPAATATAELESLRVQAGINYGANTFTIDGVGVTGFTGGAITGSGDFIKNGTGTVVFTANTTQNNTATFTGKIFLNGGVGRFQDVNSLGSGNIAINGGILEGRFGGAFTRAQGTAANQIQITGGVSGFSGQGTTGTPFDIGSVTWGSGTFNPTEFVLQSATTNVGGVSTFSSAINLNGANRTIRSDQTSGIAGSGTFSGVISNSTGTAGIIKTGVGHHILTATNTYNGNTVVNQGILTAATTGALPGFNVAGRVTVADGATLNVRTNAAWTAANIDALRTSATWSTSGSRLGIDTNGAAFTYSSNITEALSVVKYGGNNLTLTGANTYTGKTFVSGGGGLNAPSFGNVGDASSPLGTNSTVELLSGAFLTFTGTTVQSSNKTFNIAEGSATISASGTGAGAITLSANINPTSTTNKTLQLFGTSTNANTISGVISNGAGGTLAITKGNAGNTGTWVLSGNNTYSGGTTLGGGTLVAVGANALGSGAITFNTSSTTLRFQNDANTTYANAWTAGGQNINNTYVVDRATAGAAVGLTFSQQYNRANGAVFNLQAGSNITSGTPTITFSGGFTNTDSVSATLGGSGGSGPNTFNPTGVNLVINGIASSARTRGYIFQGNTDGNQITGTFANGTGTSVRKSGTGTWTFNGISEYSGVTEVTGGTLKFGRQTALYNNTVGSWTAANLSVQSGATLAFNVGGTNEFTTGNVTTLLTNLAASSSATNGMNAGSRLGFDTTNATGGSFTVADVIADTTGASGGARGLTKLGTGNLVLTNTNTYTGATTVSAGTLRVNGSTAAGSAVSVAGTATLGGTGTVGGAVSVASGGQIDPGASIGTLAVNNTVTVAGGGKLAFELGSGTTADQLNMSSASGNILTLNTNSVIRLVANGFDGGTGERVLVDLEGTTGTQLVVGGANFGAGDTISTFTATGANAATSSNTNLTIELSGFNLAVDDQFILSRNSAGNVVLTFAPVPEPATVLGVGALGLGALQWVRRRRAAAAQQVPTRL